MLTTFVERLAAARIGDTYNQYADSEVRRERLVNYLVARGDAATALVGEAAGYRGARISGVPFTSERQLSGRGPGEATATIVQRTLIELDIADDVVLWNVVPTHPGTERSNRRPSRVEIDAALPFLSEITRGRCVVAIGRMAQVVTGAPYVRHPSHGGAEQFREMLSACLR